MIEPTLDEVSAKVDRTVTELCQMLRYLFSENHTDLVFLKGQAKVFLIRTYIQGYRDGIEAGTDSTYMQGYCDGIEDSLEAGAAKPEDNS